MNIAVWSLIGFMIIGTIIGIFPLIHYIYVVFKRVPYLTERDFDLILCTFKNLDQDSSLDDTLEFISQDLNISKKQALKTLLIQWDPIVAFGKNQPNQSIQL